VVDKKEGPQKAWSVLPQEVHMLWNKTNKLVKNAPIQKGKGGTQREDQCPKPRQHPKPKIPLTKRKKHQTKVGNLLVLGFRYSRPV